MARGALWGETPLARMLISRDISLPELAQAAGLSEQTVRYLARGGHPSRVYRWTPYTLARISAALGVDPAQLAPGLVD